jgi:hypothetical protein
MSEDSNQLKLAKARAEIRKALAPDLRDRTAGLEACEDCGVIFARPKGKRLHHCADCAALRAVKAADSMQNREGPIYEKAVVKQRAYWTAEAERLVL